MTFTASYMYEATVSLTLEAAKTVNGKTPSFSPVLVDPQWRAYIQLSSNQPDKGINGGVDATMEAVDASSVPYTFVASQDWM